MVLALARAGNPIRLTVSLMLNRSRSFQLKTKLILGGILVPTDPRLGIDGRPQSASGQTTILTGINAPGLLGYHKQGFPNAAMREIIGRAFHLS